MGNRAGHWADRVAELCGAAALGGGAGAAAWLVAPLTGITPGLLAAGGTVIGALGGWAIVHAVPQGGVRQALPEFSVEPLADVIGADPLLLDELLLDQPLAANEQAEPSRVVQLFDPPAAETPGAMQARIAAHLGDSSRAARPAVGPSSSGAAPAPWNDAATIPDASDALHAALDEIRRSLRTG